MTTKAPSYQHYPDKWLADTRRLSYATKGIYIDLLNIIWMQFQDTCSIPDDDQFIASEIGCTLQEWQEARKEIQNPHRPLLISETNRLFNKGLWKEREKQQSRREKLRENGLKGGRPKKPKNQEVVFGEPKHKAGSENQNISLPSSSSVPSSISSPISIPSPTPVIKKNIKKKESLIKHGEYQNVLLTKKQHQSLEADFGDEKTCRLIKEMDEGVQMKGYKYKDFNLAIRKWEKNGSNKNNGKPPREEREYVDNSYEAKIF